MKTIKIDNKLAKQIKILAAERGVPMQDIVHAFLETGIKEASKPSSK